LGGSSGKGAGQQDRRRMFFAEVAGALAQHAGADTIVVAGPGFAKEDFHKLLKDKHPAIAKKTVLETCGHAGPAGFQELLRRGVVAHIAQTARLAREAQLIEQLLAEVAKGGKGAYGIGEVTRAAQTGAIETLLVADSQLGKFDEQLGAMVERARGRVVVFSGEAEPGKRLEALGGLGAILRFKI
ncbi:MAG: mRNA surveillance protein Pelota, partial [Euryarchaeota archaeon]|nr:mRNA surveillance protein Pelota [Euryarchaeota archaeon]